MRRALALLLLLPGLAWGVVDPIPDQSAYEWAAFSSTDTLTVDGSMSSGDSWSEPTTGNIILMAVTAKDAGASNDVTWPAGFTEICNNMGSDLGAAVAWKVATASAENSLTVTLDTGVAQWMAQAIEIDSTDLDTSAIDASDCDATNIGTSVTSQSSGTATAAAADGVAVAIFAMRRSNTWEGTDTYTNSFIERDFARSGSSHAGFTVATKAITASGSQTTTMATTDSGDPAHGALILFTVTATAGSFSDTSPTLGATTTYTCGSTFASAITTLTSPDGDVINAETGATTCSADFIIPSIDEFTPTGDMNNTEWDVDGTWTVTGTGTETPTLQIDPPVTGGFGQLACTSCPGDALDPAGVALADDYYMRFTTGSGITNDYMVAFGDGESFVVEARTYDDSGSVWTAPVSTDFEVGAVLEVASCKKTVEPLVSSIIHEITRGSVCN